MRYGRIIIDSHSYRFRRLHDLYRRTSLKIAEGGGGSGLLVFQQAAHLVRHHAPIGHRRPCSEVFLVSGASLSDVASGLGFADIIVFGSSETGTGKRGLHSALENVYEAVVAALYLDGGVEAARDFIYRTLIPRMSEDMALEPENPKSALQERLQEDGITPTYKLVETQGPPHDRTFVAQVFAGNQGLARGTGRTKKEAESQAAKSTLSRLGEFFGLGMDEQARAEKAAAAKRAKADKAAARAEEKARKKHERELHKSMKQG